MHSLFTVGTSKVNRFACFVNADKQYHENRPKPSGNRTPCLFFPLLSPPIFSIVLWVLLKFSMNSFQVVLPLTSPFIILTALQNDQLPMQSFIETELVVSVSQNGLRLAPISLHLSLRYRRSELTSSWRKIWNLTTKTRIRQSCDSDENFSQYQILPNIVCLSVIRLFQVETQSRRKVQ